jgi:hypothetical protein
MGNVTGTSSARRARWVSVQFLDCPKGVTTMSSRNSRRESVRVVFTTGLSNHLKPEPSGSRAQETGKAKSGPDHSVSGKVADKPSGRRGSPAKPIAKPEIPTKPEPVAGWVTRGEARALLGVEDSRLTDLLRSYQLSRSRIEVYSKAEILALRGIVKKLQ